jgi:hypothetical protein
MRIWKLAVVPGKALPGEKARRRFSRRLGKASGTVGGR